MNVKSALSVIILLAGVGFAQDAPKPLTKQRLIETLDVLKGPAADVLIPQVRERGVEFALLAQDEQELRAAGASEKLLAAIREAYKAPPLGPVTRGAPLTRDNLILLLENGILAERIEQLADVRGVSFAATAEDLRVLSSVGASRALLEIVKTRVVAEAPPESQPQQQQAPPPPETQKTDLPTAPNDPEPVWVVFYGVCQQGFIGNFRPTISGNDKDLATLSCNSYFYTVVEPGSYKFCATTRKCKYAVLSSGALYYFRVRSAPDYAIDPITTETGQAEMRDYKISPLDPKRFVAPEVVTIDSEKPPQSVLSAMPAPGKVRK